VASWTGDFAGRSVAVVCQGSLKLSQGLAAWLRNAGSRAVALEGGFEAWAAAGGLLVRPDHAPPRDPQDRTIWVTRARPKIDRIACPWLIRRFVDPGAVFLFVAPSEVLAVAEHFGATPFDIEGVFWSHRGDLCTFDVMVEEFGLRSDPPLRLTTIVRDADTARLDIAAEAAGLLAASLGLSRIYREDLAQLDAAMGLYDAFYRRARERANQNRAQTPALLKGLIFGADGRALSPTYTRKGGRLYRYYVAQRVLKGDAAGDDSLVRRVSAAAIEAAVVEQLRALLQQPAIIVGTWLAARIGAPDLTETEVQRALGELDPLWGQLFPAEQARIIRLLVERVVVSPTGADIQLRVEGLASLVRDLGVTGTPILGVAA
jgi:hypothetical protein